MSLSLSSFFLSSPASGLIGSLHRACMCCVCALSHVQRFLTPWSLHHAPLSLGFFRRESWRGLPFPSPGDLPHPGVTPTSLTSLHWQVGSLPAEPLGKPPLRAYASMFMHMYNIYLLVCLYVYTHVFRRRQWHPTPVLLPGKSHGQRSLVGCSPWGR